MYNTFFYIIRVTLKFFNLPNIVTPIPNYVVTELEKIQKSLLWANSSSKIKHNTLCNDYEDGGLKNVDIRKKITNL